MSTKKKRMPGDEVIAARAAMDAADQRCHEAGVAFYEAARKYVRLENRARSATLRFHRVMGAVTKCRAEEPS